MRQPRRGDANLAPTVDGRRGGFDQPRNGTRATQRVDHLFCESIHAMMYAIIGSSSQAKSSDYRDCDIRNNVPNGRMALQSRLQPEAADIFRRLDDLGLKQRDLAKVLGLEDNKISKAKAGERQFKAGEVLRAKEWLDAIERRGGFVVTADIPEADPESAYVPVEVLPTFAGMGGGGNGDGDREVALIPRALIVDVLRGSPADFLLINVRGDSMEPDFRHGDQILIDKRDTSPAQPGPFALWDGDWGEFVVKNVERARSGEVRIFSSNPKYSAESAPAEHTRIIGRPVWFGRRL